MSFKVQVVAALLTAGAAVSIVMPLSLVSRNSVYKLSFDEFTLKKVVKDANSIYIPSETEDSLE